MNQAKFYEYRKKCVNGVMVNGKYRLSTTELMDIIDNIVIDLKEINGNKWKIELEEKISDGSNVLYIEKI